MTRPRPTVARLVAVLITWSALSGIAAAHGPTGSAARSRAHAMEPTADSLAMGYWIVTADGHIGATGLTNPRRIAVPAHLNQPIVGIASGREGEGFWQAASDGGVFAFGYAGFHGSMGAVRLNRPVVGIAGTPSGNGYWLVASDGGIFSFGDAQFHGSTGATRLNQPVVGMASTPDGGGYWLVASDGGIFAFGDARFHGSMGATRLNRPIVGMAATPDGGGYWLVASDGGIFAFGDAQFFGSDASAPVASAVIGMGASSDGGGYWLALRNGHVDGFGDAPVLGSWGNQFSSPVVGFAAARPHVPAAVEAESPFEYASSGETDTNADYGTDMRVAFTVQNFIGDVVVGNTLDFQLVGFAHATLASASVSGEYVVDAVLTDTTAGDQGYVVATVHGTSISGRTDTMGFWPGQPVAMHFVTQPVSTPAGQTMPELSVTAVDKWGNRCPMNIQLAIGSNPGGGTLSGTTTQGVGSGGPAQYIDLSIDKAGSGYTLVARAMDPYADSLAPVTSAAFDIT